MNTRPGFRGGWVILFVACVLLLSGIDALLLEISQTFFTAGFNGAYIEGAGPIAAFAAISLLADACLILFVWTATLSLFSIRRGTAAQKAVIAASAALAVPLSIDFVRFQVGSTLGRMVSIPILWEVAGGGLRQVLGEAALHAGPLAAVVAGASLAVALVVWTLGRVQRGTGRDLGFAAPKVRRLWAVTGGLFVLASVALVATSRIEPRLYAGLSVKPSGSLLVGAIQVVTDVDRDGFGLLARPADPDPFDASRNPFALDLPGNGIDEDGAAGDLPTDVAPPPTVEAVGPDPRDTRRPDFLLVFLESFRADLLGRERNGREITPFLNALAREGTSSRQAWVNSPYTIWSRAQLFGGRLDPSYDQKTLIDDFHERGYTVAYFSGQDDSFGDSADLLGTGRADHFYDAREDEDRRTSRSASAGSLQISWKLLLERVDAYLDDYDPARPLFLYVNIVDTHFPYNHDELDDLLGVPTIDRYAIRADNAEAVRTTYDNTAANVDRAIERLVARFRGTIDDRDHAILVVSDHGQALFDRGFLGHGQSLTAEQTRTPFVLWGVGGEWPEPLGMSDVRGLLTRNLFVPRGDGVPRARFVPDRKRGIFEYMAQIHHPHLIGLRTLGGLTSYDLDRGDVELFGPGDVPLEPDAATRRKAFDQLIWTWEAARLDEERGDHARPRRRQPGPA